MNETTYIYICHSDIDEANIYAEFATEEEAIAYAERHIDDLTYVDKVEVALDEDGEIIEMFDSDTIWIYFDSKNYEADSTDFSEDTDDGLYEDLVEAMEENEDMVECKECFELFPKADGIKIKVGYLCPHCHGHSIKSDSDFYVSEKDFFNTDFPEVEPFMDSEDEFADACAEPVVEPECVGPDCEAPVEAPVTKEETVATLVKDEHEAIDGYDKAEVEVASNPELDPEEKEEIIDTLRHIKDEEVEHIEELEELIDGKTEEPVEDEATSLNEGYTEFHPVVIDKAALEWLAKDLMRFGGSSPFDVGIATGGDGPYYDGNLILDLRYEDGIYFAETYIDCGNGPQEDPEFLEEVGEHESLEDLLNALQEQGWVKLVLDESLEEETHAKYAKPEGNRVQAYNNALAYAKKENTPFIYGYTNHTGKFFALEQPIKVKGDSVDAEKDFKNTYKNCNVVYVAYPNKSFIKESLYNFTEEEMETYGIDEDGYEVDGYGDWVRCNWCKEPFPKEDCVFELNMGWLCDRCQEDIYYHGGPLTTTEEPTEDQIRATLNESGVIAAAVSGILVDVVRRIFDKAGEFKKKSKWIDYAITPPRHSGWK